MIYLGFDTSNYTTSLAACGQNIEINLRSILQVKHGERGLRQSDAVFQHLKELPNLFSSLSAKVDFNRVSAIGVSTRPRNIEGSYMPVFLTGNGYARVCADTLKVPLLEFSHQDGHIMAGIHSCNHFELLDKPFISVHLSGGTCEILLTEYCSHSFNCTIIGGSKDISAGQLIDRVGVKIGLDFPCGKELEKIAKLHNKKLKLPVSVDDTYINFSGIETKAMSLIGVENDEDVANGVFSGIASALSKALSNCAKKYNISDVLIVGGVAANSIIKKHLLDNLSQNLHFASVEYSTDNAYGIARLAELSSKNMKG